MSRRRITRDPEGERPRGVKATLAVEHVMSGDPLIAYVEELAQALLSRNTAKIKLMLRDSRAFGLPREVREEAIAFKRLRPRSLRSPIHTLRFAYLLRQLAVENPEGADSSQFELFSTDADVPPPRSRGESEDSA